jgi:epsilon-lactone hydrolase
MADDLTQRNHERDLADGTLSLPARDLPVPRTISAEARAALSMSRFADLSWPTASDKGAWKSFVAERDLSMAEFFSALPRFDGTIRALNLSQAALYDLTPAVIAPRHRHRAVLYVHGGAFVMGGGELAAKAATDLASVMQCKVYSVDYRMPPDHPFPAGLDDTVEAYGHVCAKFPPGNVAILGPSAGGGIAASAILKIRDLGLPLPGAAALLTPEADLTESGDSFETNRGIDTVLRGSLMEANLLYAGGHDLRDPYLSAIFADFSKGYPPTLLISGTRDLFLSNTVLLHRALRRADVETDLHIFEAMPHGGFFGAPEDRESLAEQIRFLDRHLGLESA